MTWTELVQDEYHAKGFAQPCEEECDFVLWEKTAFPFADEPAIRQQIREALERLSQSTEAFSEAVRTGAAKPKRD